MIAALRSIKRTAEHDFHFPQIPLEQAAEELFDLIRRTGIASEAARVACVGANLVQVADAGRDLLHAVPFTGFGTGSVSAGTVPKPASTDVYLWYPSWLANNHRPFQIELALIVPGDDVVKTAAGQIVQRNTWRKDTFISETSGDWSQVRKVDDGTTTPYSFGTISAETMETIAWISSITANGFELLFHLISLEEGDYASNILNGIGATGYGTWKALKREPPPWWLEGLIGRFAFTFGASFERVHTKAAFGLCFKEWLTLAGPDYAEMLSYKYFTGLARDLLLSILTLINHKAPDTDGTAHPRNREEIDAVRNIIVLGLQNLVLALGFDRKNWGLLKPGGDYGPMAEFFLIWGVLMGTSSASSAVSSAASSASRSRATPPGRRRWTRCGTGSRRASFSTPTGSTSSRRATPRAGRSTPPGLPTSRATRSPPRHRRTSSRTTRRSGQCTWARRTKGCSATTSTTSTRSTPTTSAWT